MQISTDDTKNNRKLRSRSSLSASRPSAARSEKPFDRSTVGGVAGSERLNKPNKADITAPIKNVLRKAPCAADSAASHLNTRLISRPATIHPAVPHTRTNENCRDGSASWRNEIEFTSASVGMYAIMYAST